MNCFFSGKIECTLEIKLKSIPISDESFYEVPVATEKKKRQNGKFFLNQCGQCCLFSLTIQNWWLTSTFGTLRSLLWAIALLASHRHCHFPGSIIPFYWGCGTYLLTRAEGSEAEPLPDTKERSALWEESSCQSPLVSILNISNNGSFSQDSTNWVWGWIGRQGKLRDKEKGRNPSHWLRIYSHGSQPVLDTYFMIQSSS